MIAFKRMVALSLVVLSPLAGGQASAATTGWTHGALNVRASRVTVASARGVAHVLWVDWRTPDTGGYRLLYERGADLGESWGGPVSLAHSRTAFVDFIGVVASGRTVIAAYTKGQQTFIRRSRDTGATWGPPLPVPVPFQDVMRVALAGPILSFAWTNHATGAIELRRSLDAGTTFRPRQDIGTAGDCTDECDGSVALGARGDTVWVSWLHLYSKGEVSRLWMARSTDGGAHFEAPVMDDRDIYLPPDRIAIDGTSAVAEYEMGSRLVLGRSDGGVFDVAGMGSITSHWSGGVALRQDGRVFAAFGVETNTGDAAGYRTSPDGGLTLSPPGVIEHFDKTLEDILPVASAQAVLVILRQRDASGVGDIQFARRPW